MKQERTETYSFLKEKRTSLLYGEGGRTDRGPMMEGSKVFIPKYVFNGKVPATINITVEWDDEI